MKKGLYILYVIFVIALTIAVGSEDSDSRHWSGGSSGRSGWSSGGGHK